MSTDPHEAPEVESRIMLSTDPEGYFLLSCACPDGEYIGARASGTPDKCERCGCMTRAQFEAIERALRAEGARAALSGLADVHERLADMLAITYQDPERRKAATWPHRWLVHILRVGLTEAKGVTP